MAMPDVVGLRPANLGALLDHVRRRLREAGIADAGREARFLIGALIKVAPETFIGHPEAAVRATDCDRVLAGLAQRLEGMPIGRIVGQRAFYGRPFQLAPAILEPRPDSEVLVDATLEVIDAVGWRDKPLRLIDVGTGSGCLLITLLAELPHATGVGVDIAPDALAIARLNAQTNGVIERAMFVEGDALGGIDQVFDVLVSNPPYIATDDIAGLDVEVRAHDPRLALDGGADGLEIYRRISRDIGRVVPNGWYLFEVGAGMADAVCHEIDQFSVKDPSSDWKVWQDLNGHARCVAAKTLND